MLPNIITFCQVGFLFLCPSQFKIFKLLFNLSPIQVLNMSTRGSIEIKNSHFNGCFLFHGFVSGLEHKGGVGGNTKTEGF